MENFRLFGVFCLCGNAFDFEVAAKVVVGEKHVVNTAKGIFPLLRRGITQHSLRLLQW